MSLRVELYCIFLLSIFVTVLTFANSSAKCGNLFIGDVVLFSEAHQEVQMAWQDLLALDIRKKLPNKHLILSLTQQLSMAIAKELHQKGYRTRLLVAPREVFPNFDNLVKPARWVVEILPDLKNSRSFPSLPRPSRQKIIIQNALMKQEARIYFDFLGLWLSRSVGAADYDGQTRMGFNKELYELLDSDFVTVLLHEIHHAFNHKRLKLGKKGGLNAEVNIFSESKKIFRIPGYPKHFHFDEIMTNYRQYKQINGRLKHLQNVGSLTESEKKSLLAERAAHLETLLSLTRYAKILTQMAIEFMNSELGQTLWEKEIIWYLPDPNHNSFSANIPLSVSNQPDLQQFKFTIWLPGSESRGGERTEENKNLIVDELNELYLDVIYYRKEALKLKRDLRSANDF